MSAYLKTLPPPTVRLRIIDHLKERFEKAKAGQGGRYITWNTVATQPITKPETIAGSAVGIYDSRERKKPEAGYARSTIQLATEFHVRLAQGDDATRIANLVLGEVQAIMLSDIHCGGLSLNIVETGNELDVEGPNGTLVSGIVFWEVLYRHKAGDPRTLVGE